MRNVLRRLHYTLLLTAAVTIVHGLPALSAASMSQLCDQTCGPTADCSTECYPDGTALENGYPLTTCGDWGDCALPPTCANLCGEWIDGATACQDANEDWITCEDYGTYLHCGDKVCVEGAEDCDNCSDDCKACPPTPTCGANGCETGENCLNCPEDCGGCSPTSSCNNNGSCEPGEDKSCEDCQMIGFCQTNNDCRQPFPDCPFICVNDRCVPSDLPWYAPATCDANTPCPIGYDCVDSQYICGGVNTCYVPSGHCKICVRQS